MDKNEFSERVQARRKELFAAAFSVVRNTEDAKDAVSEAVASAWMNLAKLKDVTKFDAWLLKAVYNEAKDIYKKNRAYADINELSEAFSYGADMGNVEFFDVISRCGFDKTTHQILVMRFVYDYTLEQTAADMEIPLSTVKTKYYRALEKLSRTEGLR
ncbi:MAG: RNA polymerase sigma factor [Clostridia bacterium]|nr:RNA polymerase sigma factor [Clostridia bacterium]